MANPIEMGNTHDAIVSKLRDVPGYKTRFNAVFGTDSIDIDHVAKAIATFERTVLSGNSPYDQYKAGKKKAMTPQQVRGMQLFFGKADATHATRESTSQRTRTTIWVLERISPIRMPGRFMVTKNEADWGAFKTPTLREIAKTGPYMHDGSMQTLEEVVDFYDKGGLAE